MLQLHSFQEFHVWCGLTVREFEQECGVSGVTLRALRFGGTPRMKTWRKVLEGLNRIVRRVNAQKHADERIEPFKPQEVMQLFAGVLNRRLNVNGELIESGERGPRRLQPRAAHKRAR